MDSKEELFRLHDQFILGHMEGEKAREKLKDIFNNLRREQDLGVIKNYRKNRNGKRL